MSLILLILEQINLTIQKKSLDGFNKCTREFASEKSMHL